jgi:prevent-host-death family protein
MGMQVFQNGHSITGSQQPTSGTGISQIEPARLVSYKLTFWYVKCTLDSSLKGSFVLEDKMIEISAKEARSKLSMLLKYAEAGDEVVILRRGKKVARLLPSRDEGRRLPSLREFRASIRVKGDTMSAVIMRERKEKRY